MSSSVSSSSSEPTSGSKPTKSSGSDSSVRPGGGVDRPAFNQLYESEASVDRPPTSIMAYLAFALGLISLIAPVSFKLVPLAVMAVALAGLVYWQLARDTSRASGLKWAQVGFGLGLVSLIWSLTANGLANRYFYDQAGRHAKVYLELIGNGGIYEALELHVTKSGRQIAGTDLAAYYTSKTGMEADGIVQIVNSTATREIERLGKDATWSLLSGVEVQHGSESQSITVRMANDLEPETIATITLKRNFFNDTEGRRVAWWQIERVTFDDPAQPKNSALP